MPHDPGDQVFHLEAHGYEADVAARGATLVSLRFLGRDLILPVASADRDDAPYRAPDFRGAVLAPWPGRLADGRFTWHGTPHDVGIDEPGRRTALHGRVWSQVFVPRAASSVAVHLAATLDDAIDYPGALEFEVIASLTASGLVHRIRVTHRGEESAPVGWGVHPYLLAGHASPGAVDGWRAAIPAARVMTMTPDRLLPEPVRPAEGDLDLRAAPALGSRRLNHAFTALARDRDGNAHASLTGPSGDTVTLTLGKGYRWLQAYTSDESAGNDRRAALALEPMTCPPDALHSGTDLLTLEPGESASASFTIAAIRADR
ncbi:galactose mutarotase [Demequina sp. NBRC 110055]|uniref:aldose epimerase family protein n=1 Tax=Demequina sp. NBRC 110055 TaxID=1570344 RepID=UPI0013564025|nr:galactose mutarotase [Demequina sp. NBRC 110055]